MAKLLAIKIAIKPMKKMPMTNPMKTNPMNPKMKAITKKPKY